MHFNFSWRSCYEYSTFSISAESLSTHTCQQHHTKHKQIYWPIKLKLFLRLKKDVPFDMENCQNLKSTNLVKRKALQVAPPATFTNGSVAEVDKWCWMMFYCSEGRLRVQGPVVQRVNSFIQRINSYTADKIGTFLILIGKRANFIQCMDRDLTAG